MITEEAYAALLALRRERNIPTVSKTVGEALREWAEARSGDGLKLVARSWETKAPQARPTGFKPGAPLVVSVKPWEEIRGVVMELSQEGSELRVAVEEEGRLRVLALPGPPRGPVMQVGATVAILRTDAADEEYVVRVLD